MEKNTYIEGDKTYKFIPSNSFNCRNCCFYSKDLTNTDCNNRPCMSHLRKDRLNGYFTEDNSEIQTK